MIIFNTIVLALQAIRRNGIRSILTALGVVIGVASVITMVNLGQAATQNVTNQISTMGPNLLFVRPAWGRRGMGGTRAAATVFEVGDVDAIVNEVEGVRAAPGATSNTTFVYGNLNHQAQVIGTKSEFFTVREWSLSSGRTFEPSEERSGAAVCIVGATVAKTLWRGEDPIGTQLRVARVGCQVIGVLQAKGESLGQDQDDVVLMPLRAVQRRILGNENVDTIYVSATETGSTGRVKADIEALLRQRRGLARNVENDFDVRDMQEVAATLSGATATLTTFLAAIAAVSLLVGGIGIMNIMLVSVTERTREIGVRLAIGARGRDVLLQFLVEAVVLSLFGGAVGVALGIGATYVASAELSMPFIVAYEVVALAFGVSALIGIAFGYLPARKAASLDPIVALRHE